VNGKSLYFSALNYGKESIALDLRAAADRALFDDLLATADVLVENFRPGVLERLGYGWTAMHARWPALVYAVASGFGHTGPLRERPAFDLVAQAMGGIVSLTGHPDGPPARVGVSIGDIAAGLFLATGISSALYKRRETGVGTMIDVAMLDCQLAILENALTTHLVTGALPGRLGTRHPNIAPFQAFAAGDGKPIVVCAGHDDHFAAFSTTIDRPELPADPRFATADARRRHVDELETIVLAALSAHPAAEWLARLEQAGVPCAPVQTVAEAVRHPQVAARGMVKAIPDPRIGTLYVAGNPIKMSSVPDRDPERTAPELDADRARIVAELGRG
jgi:CoA:oxalate CoA-transferase